MNDSKKFHISDVLTITSGKLISLEHIGGVYKILGYMTDSEPYTHQLPRLMMECEPELRRQHPELSAVEVPDDLDSYDAIGEFLVPLYREFGAYVEVQPLSPEDHTSIDPISELKMLRPDAEIIVIGEDK